MAVAAWPPREADVKRNTGVTLAVLVLAALVALPAVAAGADAQRDRERQQTRSVVGQVMDHDDAPLPDSIVYLKNVNTLAVRTFISDKDGNYQFHALSPNVDYELFAEYKGQRSPTRMLSAFDSRPRSIINLKIDTKK
jgi:protocatechuate 3,4-dioxygenase beta subunit